MTIKKIDDATLIVEETTVSERIVKKSSLEGQRITLIEEHEKKLAEIDEMLAVFK